MKNFRELLKSLLVQEYGRTPEDAERLVKAYPDIVMQGIMANNLDATAIALEMKEAEDTPDPSAGTN
jgi:hypothetical protein